MTWRLLCWVLMSLLCYPNLTDPEVANICYDAVMKSKIKFMNINYRKGLPYIAINMNKTDQRTSPLWRVLPRRTG